MLKIAKIMADKIRDPSYAKVAEQAPEHGPFPGIDFARLERHANEHRLMELLGLNHRGRPLVGGASPIDSSQLAARKAT